MKLSQVYANKKFKTVRFNEGLNLILAKVTKEKDLQTDSHNLGKSTLIPLLDFLLLKQIDKNHFLIKHKDKFKDHVFYLEIKLNSSEYLTIRRKVNNPSKISFKNHPNRFQNFIKLDSKEWDEYNLPFKKAQKYLNEKLSFTVIPKWEYRKSISYFLRTQYDYRDVFQLQKFSSGEHIHWKPFLFDLLGFDGNILTNKYELEKTKENQKLLISDLKNQLSVNPEEIDKIKGAIEIKKEEKEELEEEVNSFNFYLKERNLNKELVEEIEREISDLNTKEYNISYELNQIEESFDTKSLVRFDEIKKIWEEAKIHFKDTTIKEYEEIEQFNIQITEERQKYLKERYDKLFAELKSLRTQIQELNEKRKEVLSFLKEKDSFKKFKEYQNELTHIETEIVRLEEQLKNMDHVASLENTLKETNNQIEDLSDKIKEEVDTSNSTYSEIRRNFRNIIKSLLDVPAIIYLVINKSGNVEFYAEIQNKEEIEITAEGQGYSYKKFLCIAFDLAVLMTYSNKSFYRFVYHDGALEGGLDNRKKKLFIKFLRDEVIKKDIQYIFTAIEDDLPMKFAKEEIAVILDDSGDEGKLFEMSF